MIQKFGGNVRRLRIQRGWSQIKFAELTGLNVTFIRFVEYGHRGTKLNSIVRIQKALGCDVKDLFDGSKSFKLKKITTDKPNTLNDRQIILKFGSNVRKLRGQRGWSQEMLGKKAGMMGNHIGFVECGNRNIWLKNILKIQKALGCDIKILFEGI